MTNADIELERHIRDCGRLLIKAYNEGNAEATAKWLALQNEAIKGRSPAHVAEMERERGLVESECSFARMSDQARAEAFARGAHD